MNVGLRDGTISLLVLLAFAGSISGCGGGSSTPAKQSASSTSDAQATTATRTAPSEVSKAQLIAQADEICRKAHGEVAAVKPKNGSAREIERIVPHHAALERRAIAELLKLSPPPSVQRSLKTIVGYRETLVDELNELVNDAKRKNFAAARTLVASKKRAHEGLLKAATAAGFSDCAMI